MKQCTVHAFLVSLGSRLDAAPCNYELIFSREGRGAKDKHTRVGRQESFSASANQLLLPALSAEESVLPPVPSSFLRDSLPGNSFASFLTSLRFR
uniref:Putative secreted protein n=1 Tax=Ixodes ricinus TaxID=34613 RepID=A0A6B0U612_IXORI